MFKYKNVMIALFTLFFFFTSIHFMYSCLTLEAEIRNIALICDCALFAAPLAIFVSGKLKRAMPYILVGFYVTSCLVMSVINQSELYLPLLFACFIICCGFFLSVKLCVWYVVITDAALIASVFFLFYEEWDNFTLIYFTLCVCYNFSAFAITLFVYAVKRNILLLRRKNKELTASDNRKNAFWAAAASHMRSASDRLVNYCAVRLEDELSDTVREKITSVKSEAMYLTTVLNDAEDYAMLENKKLETVNRPYSFVELVNEISDSCAMLITVAAGNGISYTIDCQPDIPAVMIGDMGRISQVIMKLFENAAKYTENGSVSIAFSSRKTEDGINLQIIVSDTGTGFSDSAARKMFTVYADKRGQQTVSHVGLAIVKELVTLMGGFIYVRRRSTHGTSVVVTLPQGVKVSSSFAEIYGKEKMNALIYTKEKSDALRINKKLEKIGVKSEVCLSRTEFSIKKDAPGLTHIFTDYPSYSFDSPVFKILSRNLIIIVVCQADEIGRVMPENIYKIPKPINMASVSRVLNETVLNTSVTDVSDFASDTQDI